MSKFIHIFLFLALMISPSAGFAFETDQFNLPEEPLADIGAEVGEYVRENVAEALAKINREIEMRRQCLENEKAKNCESARRNRERLKYLRSDAAVAREVFKRLGAGFPPFTASGSWMEAHRFAAQPARYKTAFKNSICATFPSNYLTISETVKLYDAEFGTDKIAHIFQQGYTYLRIYERALAKGLSKEAATKRASAWGRMSERTFYGNLVSGVYSNADLAANFAGLKFYQNLTGEIKIGDATKSPLVISENGAWKFNPAVDLSENLLKPFVSDHLNEAFNPSIYTPAFGLRSAVRRRIKKHACERWRETYPNFSATDFERKTKATQTWFGEDYGFTFNGNFVTVAGTCFVDNSVMASFY